MDNSVNIKLEQLVGAKAQSGNAVTKAKSLSSADLSGFIDALTSSLMPQGATLNTEQLNLEAGGKQSLLTMAVNLASQLKEQGLLPESLENISLGELSQNIFSLLKSDELLANADKTNTEQLLKTLSSLIEKHNGKSDNNIKIRPSLISDLTSATLEVSGDKDEGSLLSSVEKTEEQKLAELLIGKNSEALTTSDIAEAMSQLENSNNKDEFVSDTLLTLAQDAEGLKQEAVKTLNNSSSELATIAPKQKDVGEPAFENIQNNIAAGVKNKKLSTNADILISKEIRKTKASVTEEALLSNSQVLSKSDKNILVEMMANNGTAKTNSQQNLTSKISGMSVSSELIQSMADGSFEGDTGSFSQNSEQTLYDLDGLASQTSTKALSGSNSFSNYLTTAKGGASTPTTQMIALQLKHNANAKVSNMKLQLTPEHLGKLDINLKFGKDGSIKAHLVVEKSETLSMLKKDAVQLERILQDAGFDTSQDSLSFDLNQSSQDQLGAFKDNNNKNNYNESFASSLSGENMSLDNMIQAQIAVETTNYISSHGVNIKV